MVPYGLKFDYIERMSAGFILASIIFLYNIEIPLPGGSTLPIYLPLMAIYFVFGKFRKEDAFFIGMVSLLMISFFIIQRFVAPVSFSPLKSFMGIIFFIIVSGSITRLWSLSYTHEHQQFILFTRWMLWLHLTIQILGVLKSLATGDVLQSNYFSWLPRAVGIAGESSHVGMILGPLIFWSIVYTQSFNKHLGKSGHVLLFVSSMILGVSATALVAYFCSFVCLFIRKKSLLPLLWGIPFSWLLIAAIPKIQERIIGMITISLEGAQIGSDNLSVLVLFKGIEMAYGALLHHPFGVGMLNFKELVPYSFLAQLGPPLDTLNSNDGSSLLAKGIGEFGYPFLLMYLAALVTFVRDLWKKQSPDLDFILRMCFIFAFIVSAIRGASYFMGPSTAGLFLVLYGIFRYRGTFKETAEKPI